MIFYLKILNKPNVCRAKWGVSGALYPQSAIAGLDSFQRFYGGKKRLDKGC